MVLVTFLWGGNFTATKLAFTQMDPLAFTALRFLAGSIIVWLIVGRLEGHQRPPAGAMPRLVILGVLGNTAYQLCFIEGLARTSAIKSALILSLLPVMVTLAAWLLGIERVSLRQRMAVAIAFSGTLVVLMARGGTIGGGLGMGELLTLIGTVAWTGYTLLLRQWALPMSSLSITAWTLYTGTPLLVLIGLPGVLRTDWTAVSAVGWSGVAYATLLSLVASYVLWNRGVAMLGASKAATYNTLVPFIATAIAIIGLGERPGPLHVVGGCLIVCGVLLSRREIA
jgi:drug/metabolite transporter (DMT)-like permease